MGTARSGSLKTSAPAPIRTTTPSKDTPDKIQIEYASEAVPAYIAAAAAAARPLLNGKPPEPMQAQIIEAAVYPNPFRFERLAPVDRSLPADRAGGG